MSRVKRRPVKPRAEERLDGIYAIYLVGTPFVYVGCSDHIARRWEEHQETWVWPNEARYEILELGRGDDSPRRRESRAAFRLQQQGYLLLSSHIAYADEAA